MIEKLPEFHFFSITTLIILVSYLIIAIIYYLFNKNKKIISTLISFIIIASCSTLYSYHNYNWKPVALSDIKEQLIINGDSLTIKALPKNIRYKDNQFENSKEQHFTITKKDDKYYLINSNNTGFELTENEYNKLRG